MSRCTFHKIIRSGLFILSSYPSLTLCKYDSMSALEAETVKGNGMKFHSFVKLFKSACHAQVPYFWY